MTAAYLIWTSTPSGYLSYSMQISSTYSDLADASLALSIATNAITTAMIAYKLWYVAFCWINLIQHFIMKLNARTHRMIIVKNLGLKGRRSPAQKVLILLVESGIVYLGFQVSLPRLTSSVQRTVQ